MRIISIVPATLTILCGLPLLAQEEPTAWIDRDRIRAAYHYANPPAEQKTQDLIDAGMNAQILKATVEKALPFLRAAKLHPGMHCFLALNFNVNAEQEGLRQAVLTDGRVERYACPLEERFWRDYLLAGMLERARLAAEPDLQVDGLWIDFELYSTVTGQRYYRNACYCDHCMAQFAQHKGITCPELANDQRAAWLAEHGYAEEYQPFLGTRVEQFAREVREQVHAVDPDLLLGFYPTPHDWSLRAVARAFSTPELPIILWATDTYGGGGPNNVPDDWRAQYEAEGINARYCAGMLLRSYSAKNLAANIYHASAKCDGYWLFTTYTLWKPEEERSGDYYLAAGTAEEYWAAIKRGNEELDRLAANPAYQSDLEIGIEPIVYHPLATPEARRRIEALVPPEVTGATVDCPAVWLRGSNLLFVAAREGQAVTADIAFGQVGGAADAIRWEVTDAEGAAIAGGQADVGADTTVAFEPPHDGLYYVLMSAGGSKYAVARTNAPVGLYATKLHTIAGAERLYFRLPLGGGECTVLGEGTSAREMIRVDLFDAQGAPVATAQSTEEDLAAPITFDATGHADEVWSLAIVKADVGILEDSLITLEAPLPPVLSLVPEHAFGTE